MTSTSVQRDQKWRRVVQKSLSKEFNIGRGRLRLSTATCCRRARTSRAVSLRLRKKTRTAAMNERMDSSTNSLCTPPYHGSAGRTARDRKLLNSKHHGLLSTYSQPLPNSTDFERDAF